MILLGLSCSLQAQKFDINYTRLTLDFNPEIKYLNGIVTHHFTPDANASGIVFDLDSSFYVDSVVYQDQNAIFTHSMNQLNISFPAALTSGQKDSVTIYYNGIPSMVSNDIAWDTAWQNGRLSMWTSSEPYGSKEWWPCQQVLHDKIDSIDLHFITPIKYETASNGIQTANYINCNRRFTSWKHRYPISYYLVGVAAAEYQVYTQWYVDQSGDSLPIVNYIFPEDSVIAPPATFRTIKMMELYDSLFTPYPYMNEKYGHAKWGKGGGMENQTITFLGNYHFELISHELAHHWFGNFMTNGSWQDLWLNEGFATYCSGLAYENMFNNFFYWNKWKKETIQKITALPGGMVYLFDTTQVLQMFDPRLRYYKGAMVLHMLRKTVGDSAFYAGIRNYLNDPLLDGFALTYDFQYHMEQASGLSLGYFFDDWIYDEGFPVFTITYNENPSGTYNFTLNQVSSMGTNTFFELPVDIRLKNGTHDTLVTFFHSANNQQFTITPGFTPDSVFFDPDRWLVAKLDGLTGIEDQVLEKKEVQVYPNPASGFVFISCDEEIQRIVIRDINGRMVYHNEGVSTSSLKIDLQSMNRGIYFISIYSRDIETIEKLVVL